MLLQAAAGGEGHGHAGEEPDSQYGTWNEQRHSGDRWGLSSAQGWGEMVESHNPRMVCAGRALKIIAFQPSAMERLPLNQVAPSSVLGHFYLFSLFINLFFCHCYSFNSLNNTARWAEWQNPSGIAEWQNLEWGLWASAGVTQGASLCVHISDSQVFYWWWSGGWNGISVEWNRVLLMLFCS